MTLFGRPGHKYDDICTYDDKCLDEPSGRFPVSVCDRHALKVHQLVEMTLAFEKVRRINEEIHSHGRRPGPTELSSEFYDKCAAIADTYIHETGPEGSVYYTRLGGMVKIGFSRNVAQRLKDIPHEEVLRVEDGTMLDEKKAHARGAAWRVVGEWFRDCPEFRAAIGLDTLQDA